MTEPLTKTLFVQCPPTKLVRFLANAENWPRWAVHNILAVRPDNDGWWLMDTPRGPGRLRIMADERRGILDHEFIDAQEGHWSVPARVIAAGGGSLFMLTLTKPAAMPTDLFEIGMQRLDDELAALKRIMNADDPCEIACPFPGRFPPVGGMKRVRVKEGRNESFETSFAELQAEVHKSEPGTVFYDLFRSRTDSQEYFVLEKYESQEAWESHQNSEHGKLFFPQIRAMLDEISVEYFDELGGTAA